MRSEWVAFVVGLTLVAAMTTAAPAASEPQRNPPFRAGTPALKLERGDRSQSG
jgi:hypothetical protein